MNAKLEESSVPAQSMELVVVQTAITRMDKLSEGLKDLQQRFGGVVFDVKTSKGMAEAKSARREVAAPRIEVEKVRKEAKAPILELGRKLDAEAKRITEAIDKIEAPIAQQITAEENRIEAERQAKVRREEQRVADIQGRINDMRSAVNGALRARTAGEVARILADVEKVVIDEELFAEFKDTAGLAKRESVEEITRIRDEIIAREKREAEAAAEAEKVRKDREDFERHRAEQEAADRARRAREDEIRERLAELHGCQTLTASSGSALISEHIEDLQKLPVSQEIFGAQLQQAIDAKHQGIARLKVLLDAAVAHEFEQAQLAEKQEAQRKENARIAAEQAAAQKKIDDDRRELETRQQAERDAQAQRDREAQEEREVQARLNFKPSFEDIVEVVANHWNRDKVTVRAWVADAVLAR